MCSHPVQKNSFDNFLVALGGGRGVKKGNEKSKQIVANCHMEEGEWKSQEFWSDILEPQ